MDGDWNTAAASSGGGWYPSPTGGFRRAAVSEEGMWWNTTAAVLLSNLTQGNHSIAVYANDTQGRTNYTTRVYFSINQLITTRVNFNATEVIIAQNTTGYLELESTNQDASPLLDQRVNITDYLPAGWLLNQSEIAYLNVSGATSVRWNITIISTQPWATFGSLAAADCVLFNYISTDYCYDDSFIDLGGGRSRYTSTVRQFVNVSERNIPLHTVLAPLPVTRFTNWNIRNQDSETAFVNVSAHNTSVAFDGIYVNVTVGTNQTLNGSFPNLGLWLLDVT